jgi:hypothetical protein
LVSLLGIAAFSIISFVGAPFALTVLINAWFTGSAVYLSAISYGIINDIIGCHKNLPYFMLGHQPGQRGVIKSNNPNTVGIAWGILATTGLAIIAALTFTVATLITGFIGLPFLGFLVPAIAAFVPLVNLAAHWIANRFEKKVNMSPEKFHRNIGSSGLDSYQNDKLKVWLRDEKDTAAWLGNSVRNVVGYVALPSLAVVGLVSFITLSILSSVTTLLPAVLFSTAVSVFPPVGLGILLAVGIIAACVHLYRNHDKQIDNAYKLDYEDESIQQAGDSPDNSPAFGNSYQHIHAQLPQLQLISDDENDENASVNNFDRARLLSSAVARDNNGDVVDLFPDGEGPQAFARVGLR